MKTIPQDGLIGLSALREAASGEYRQIMELVAAALAAKLGFPPEDTWRVNVEAMFADRAIVRRNGRYWAYAYTLGADNQVTLADAQEVIEEYVPVALREAAAAEVLQEAKDGAGTVWDAVLIRAGAAKTSGWFYPDAVLREAASKFEGARVFVKGDVEHLKGEGKHPRNVIGWISNAHFVEGAAPDTGYMAGLVNITAGETTLRANLVDAWKRGKRDLVGLSIDAVGKAKKAMREAAKAGVNKVATVIDRVKSVDLIVEPGAGGALVRMVEAADPVEEQEMSLKKRMLDTIKARKPTLFASIDAETVTDDELEAHYREALAEPAEPGQAAAAGAGITREEVNAQIRMVEARSYARVAIAEAKLPQIAKDKLKKQFAGEDAHFLEADVDAAIAAERDYLAKLTPSGKVVMGEHIEVEDRSEKTGQMLEAFFDPAHKDHRATQSIKELYIELTGDRRVTGRLEHCDMSRMRESLGGLAMRESLDSTTFGYVLGDSITRRMVAEFRAAVQYDAWRKICTVVPVNDFRTQDRTMFGGYGDLPAVNQGAPYAALGSPSDLQATYAVTKRGGTEDITLEMIKNDDVGSIRRIPVKLGRAAKRTLAKFVFDFIRTNPNIYDGVAFFHANHGNLGSTAFSDAEYAVVRLAMMKQTELSSSDRMGIGPSMILCPLDLEKAASDAFRRSTNLDETFVQSLHPTIIPVWYWTDATDWAAAADPMDIPGIEVGFLDGQEEPELFVQDAPNQGSMFSNDKLTYKIRHIYGGNVVPGGEKAFYKEVVAG